MIVVRNNKNKNNNDNNDNNNNDKYNTRTIMPSMIT